MRLDELTAYLDGYLDAERGGDFCRNGLQVARRADDQDVERVVTGVSACRELFERAREAGADAVLVHHGLFWKGDADDGFALTGIQYERVAELVRSGIALLAYHLPLDRHAEVGNNAVAARALGLEELEPFAEYGGTPIGFHGRFPEPLAGGELVERCGAFYGQPPLLLGDGPERVATLGIVSGGGDRMLHDAIALGLDAYLTGEPKEWVTNVAREAGIHFLACGHHATERCGIQALGDHLAEHLGLEVEFVDVPNPV